ncbi:unnamed protein product [Arabidopsis halleri]
MTRSVDLLAGGGLDSIQKYLPGMKLCTRSSFFRVSVVWSSKTHRRFRRSQFRHQASISRKGLAKW